MSKNFRIVGTVSNSSTISELLSSPERLSCCDVVELRFDQHMDKNECLDLCRQLRKYTQVLLTIRTSREGGTWEIDDEERFKLFDFFANDVDMIDIELKSPLFARHSRSEFPSNIQVVTSFHDYDSTPSSDEIDALISKGEKWGADIVKLAVFTHSKDDVNRLSEFLNRDSVCLIGMGAEGLTTRLEFPKMGSLLTYGYLDDCAAPGQVSAKELSDHLR